MAHQRVEVDVGLNVEKTGLTELKSSLQAIQQEANKASGSGKMTKELKEAADAAKKLDKILDGAWNSKLQHRGKKTRRQYYFPSKDSTRFNR